MSFWGLWRRPLKQPLVGSGTEAIEQAWLALIKEDVLLREGKSSALAKVAHCISDIADIIRAEEQTGNRRISLQYALDHGVFAKIADIARRCGPSIITECVAAFSILIKSGEEDLMSNQQVIKSTNIFLCELDKCRGKRVFEEEFAEMLFSVASRLRASTSSFMKWLNTSDLASEEASADHDSAVFDTAHRHKTEDEDLADTVFELPHSNSMEDSKSTADNTMKSRLESVQEVPAHREGEGASDQEISQDAGSVAVNDDSERVSSHRNEVREQLEHRDGLTKEEETQEESAAADEFQESVNQSNAGSIDQENENASEFREGNALPRTSSEADTEPNDRPTNVDEDSNDFQVATDAIDGLLSDLKLQAKTDFPLFYFLLDLIHHEGRAGEFARTGLLFIVESALPESPLEQWINESDFTTLMASGLGALYSQLSRTMLLAFQAPIEPKIVTMAKESERKFVPINLSESDDPAEIALNNIHMKEFLQYLEFWQDTLRHCQSESICANLLDNFETLFLRQLLVPSLAESTDSDGSVSGGAAIAVLTYLRVIFETLNQKDIVKLILSLLIVSPEEYVVSTPTVAPPVRFDAENEDNEERIPVKMTKTAFSLVDLMADSLESSSQQTIGAALRLMSTLVRKHYPYTLNSIFEVDRLAITFKATVTPFTVYAQEMDFFLALMSESEANDIQSQKYESYLKDSRTTLESHPFLPDQIAHKDEFDGKISTTSSTDLYSHTLQTDGKIWNDLLRLLSMFFANSVELNFVLTQVFIDMVSCGWLSLRGWMLTQLQDVVISHTRPKLEETDSDDELDYQMMVYYAETTMDGLDSDEEWGVHPDERYQETTFKKLSPTMEVLDMLNKKIDEYRQKIPGFDDQLAERRRMLWIDEDDVGDATQAAFSSPAVSQTRSDSRTFSLSSADTSRRAKEIFESTSVPSSPLSARQTQAYRTISVSSLSNQQYSPLQGRGGPQQRKRATSPLSQRQHRRAESVAGALPPIPKTRQQHRRAQSTMSPFTSPMPGHGGGASGDQPKLSIRTRDGSLKAWDVLSSSSPLDRTMAGSPGGSSAASFSASRFETEIDDEMDSNPNDFASALVLSDSIHVQSDDESDNGPVTSAEAEVNIVNANGTTETGKGEGIEMDDIVTDIGYVPAVIQVMGPETGKSRYVSVTHLLGNVIVFQEFVKELTAMIQVRSTMIDKVDYKH
ncbi:Retinoic acid induced 16-like protein-domain-containing protein [Lipomyces arxii]|uniref:Retinoic acid induced 16-like protein-domain-containing protein n=1 Tax=Lipomyces arxii TaxID=56418 RepID=UPI0034CECD9E